MNPLITHLILSPGELNGMYYLGILRYFYIEKIIENIKYIAGTSIGSYFAIVFALKIPIEYIEEHIINIFHSHNLVFTLNNNTIYSLWRLKGIIDSEIFIVPIRKYMYEKYNCIDMTFSDFVKKTGVNIYISCSCISNTDNEIFSAEQTPNISVIDILKASISFPFVFKPVVINDKIYVDGIITRSLNLNNIFETIDENCKLFINLSSEDNNVILPKSHVFSFMEYILRVPYISYNSATNLNNKSGSCLSVKDLPKRSIITGKEINISMSKEEIEYLILKGFIDISQYINNRYKDKTKY